MEGETSLPVPCPYMRGMEERCVKWYNECGVWVLNRERAVRVGEGEEGYGCLVVRSDGGSDIIIIMVLAVLGVLMAFSIVYIVCACVLRTSPTPLRPASPARAIPCVPIYGVPIPSFTPGQQAEAFYQNDWYPCRVTATRPNGFLDVVWQDRSTSRAVPPCLVREAP